MHIRTSPRTTVPFVTVIVTLLLALNSVDATSAPTRLPPLDSVHGAAFPSVGLASQDSCSMNQYGDTRLPSVYRLDLRGFRVSLLGPLMWRCHINDGDGSGAAITFAAPSPSPNPTKNSILVVASADVLDNGGNFCAYTDEVLPSWTSRTCVGHRRRPGDEEVKYLFGGPTTSTFVVLVAVPAGAPTPWLGVVAKEPTIVVLAASKVHSGAYDLVCSIGTSLSPECITDAREFSGEYLSFA